MIDDYLINVRFKEETEHFISQYKRQSVNPRPISPYISVYVGKESMPASKSEIVAGLPVGVHEAYRDGEEYHIAIHRLQNQENRLYLFYEVTDLEFTEKRKLGIRLVLVAGVILITLLGWWIGWLTSRRVIAPVVQLSKVVAKSGPVDLPINLSKSFYDDEVGVLAKGLEQAMERVETFVEREQRFSRYASHELRTPVTIIKGAVELLKKKLSPKDEPIWRTLKRIERSVINMENIIATLLWLSRENEAIERDQPFAVVPIVQETIKQNRYLIGNKPIDIEVLIEHEPQLSLSPFLLQIAVTNLIRNAIQHTESGKISVIIKHDRVIVADNGRGMSTDDLAEIIQHQDQKDWKKGAGLGLLIVKRLCGRLSWTLEIESEAGRGTTVQLIFRAVEA